MANEKRLIDANALLIPKYESSTDEFIDGYRQGKIDALIEVTALAPTVDAVEVVRCKDCMWFDTEDELADVFRQERHCFCTEMNNYVSENGFCSCGERKDNEKD